MKTKVKRYSRRSTAVILSILMIVTCLVVGQITTANAWSTSSSGIAMSTKIYTSGGEVTAWSSSGTNSSWYQDFDILTAGTYQYKIIGDKWFGSVNNWNTPAFSDSNAYNYGYNAHNNGDSDNISASFPAGQYVLHLTKAGGSDQDYISYTLYRKKAWIDFGWGSGAWNSYNMTYNSGGDGVYKYTITGNGQQLRFRTRFVDGSTETKYYPSSTDNIRDNTDYDTGYSASTGTSDNYWYVDTQDGASYTVWLKNGIVWITISGEGTHYYLTGYINGGDVTSRQNEYKFTESSTSGVYTLELSSTTASQYVTVYDTDGNAYHPGTHGASSGTASSTTDSSPGNENKWLVSNASGKTVTFTWDTTVSNPTLSWKVSGSGSSSHGTASDYKLLGSSNATMSTLTDTGLTVYYNSSTDKYYVNMTSYLSTMKTNQYYFALSSSSSYLNILGIGNNSYTQAVAKETGGYSNTLGAQHNSVNVNNVNYQAQYSYIQVKDTCKGLSLEIDNGVTTSNKITYAYTTSASAIVDDGGDDEVSTVDVYAKDGAAPINWSNKTSGGASNTSGTAYNYAAIATTAITQIDDATATGVTTYDVGDSSSRYQSAKVEVGKKLTITTTISSSNSWSSKYYVKGWCINGATYKCDGTVGVNSASDTSTSTGVCTLNYTIPEEVDVDYLEITPIYYLRDNSKCITFYLEGYNTVQNKWGNTPYIYPFYGNNDNVDNSFGCYPGQPMVYANGQYSIEIPLESNNILNANNKNGTAIKGITINNGYADHVHRNEIYGWTDHDNDADHKQTYDYDDFYKIYEECLKGGTEHPNSIIFRIQDEDTVFNRATYGGTKSGQFASGVSNISISDIASSGNGWELLTNRYDEAVNIFGSTTGITKPSSSTAPAEDTSNAIYVVSTGYNANIAGDYGTMWKIYDGNGTLISKDTTNSRYGIPPSVLVMQGSDSGITNKTGIYPDASHNVDGVGSYTDKISKYDTIYKTLKGSSYVNKRVYITYEKDAQDTRSDTNGTGAYRLDGRWYYTHATDYVQSKVSIEYYNKSTGKWISETPDAATGLGTSGNKAVFNSDSYLSASQQTTSSSKLISSGSTWNFTATAGTGYLFDSWQIKYSDTSYDEIVGAEAASSIKATANYELVARFIPIVTGSLTITHKLSTASTGEGTAGLTAVVKNGNTTLNTYNGTVTDGVARVYIGENNYISNTNSSYTIQVTLTTTPQYDGKVTAFGYDKFNSTPSSGEAITATTSPSLPSNENQVTTSTFSFTVGQLFAGTTLVTDTLAYTSTITETPHYYNFVYNLTTRGSSTANDKSYTSKGKISQKDYKAYVTNQESHVLDPSFVTAKAPFESNFLKSNSLTPGNISYTSGTHTFTATSSFAQSDSTPVHHVVFKLPYDYYNDSGTSYKKYNASNATDDNSYKDSKAVFDLAANYNSFVTIGATSIEPGSQSKVSKVTDSTDVNHTGNDFITAPDELKLNGVKKYFKYWEISKLNNEVEKGVAFAKVYYPDFHYRIYGDYYVEAVYGDDPADSWKMKYSEDATNKAASIMYIGSSRNQWNSGSDGETDDQTKASDIIYNDFIFNFADKGAELKGSSNKIGMVIERVSTTAAPSKEWAVGKANVSDMNSYKETYGDTEDDRSTRILSWLNGSSSSAPTGCVKIEYSTTDLNNKNFMEKCYTAYSAYGQKIDSEDGDAISFKNDNTMDDYVYRAYAYMKCSDNTYVLSDPAYFCMKYTSSKKQFENE